MSKYFLFLEEVKVYTNCSFALVFQVRQLYIDQGEEVISRNQHQLVECRDANSNSPLSEAAAGGSADTIRFVSYDLYIFLQYEHLVS